MVSLFHLAGELIYPKMGCYLAQCSTESLMVPQGRYLQGINPFLEDKALLSEGPAQMTASGT